MPYVSTLFSSVDWSADWSADCSSASPASSGVSGLSLCLPNYNLDKEIIMPTKKGDVLVHHCNLVHRAGKNNSLNKRRRSIGIVFIPNNCKIDEQLNNIYIKQLKEDIELQKDKNATLYEKLTT